MSSKPDQDSKPDHAGEPLVLAMLTWYAANMVTGHPTVWQATDATTVLLWGPRPLSPQEAKDLPAIRRARDERLPVVFLDARQWLTVASGGVVTVPDEHVADLDRPVRVRLATPDEVLRFDRDTSVTVDAMTGHPGPAPLTHAQAVSLTTPVDIPPELFASVVATADAELARLRHR